MRVEQLMTKDVGYCNRDESLEAAARVMWERDCGFVPVVEGAGGRVVGVITDRDVCMAAYTRGQALSGIRVGDVMSTLVRSCSAGDELAEAEEGMREAQVHRLPVLDQAGQLLGVVSLADIAREAGREAGLRKRNVSNREIGETLAKIRRPREILSTGT